MSENNTDTLKNWLIILAFIFILTLMGVVWLFLFSDFAFFYDKGLDTSNRIDYGAKVLKTIGTIFGGLAILINAYYAAKRWEAMDKSAMAANESAKAALKNAEAAQDKQITERFAKAIEQLGSEKIEVRLGAIYTLERIAKDSAKDHWTIMEVLTAFVRENAPRKLEEENTENAKQLVNYWMNNQNTENTRQIQKIRTDIQAALTIIGKLNCDNEQENQWLDLRSINIRGAYFPKETKLQRAYLEDANLQEILLEEAYLQETIFIGANLTGAKLSMAELEKAKLHKANLQGADLIQANLQGADLNGANLQKANLINAKLQGADLTGADLRGVQNLEQRQIDSAWGDHTTKLPDHLNYPKHWPESGFQINGIQ
ncbi:pentapeptide repeat-containing protein [Nostoc sp. FACHB-190]|uniref:pentapeptide repeat-containing protein n=1 Tax=Nostoc sp. FACHB-190 TaxID=2692838 RepID=UPI00168516B3|nr:pentapeptide repeat-containing protein [Nostoc sp. FACHB-190]MBD2299473.1 pentapeptide repeat-containing protein [Nostoc sp. FACHB-190]